jgi:mono/diheme cytochrome c family protein
VKTSLIALVIAAILIAAGAGYMLWPQEPVELKESKTEAGVTPGIEQANLARIEVGKELYAENCASCHGANLEGKTSEWRRPGADGVFPAPPHDETGHTWHHDDQLLFNYTKLGGVGLMALNGIEDFNSGMPAFEETLSDDEIWAVLGFIKSTWPAHIQDQQRQRTEASKQGG